MGSATHSLPVLSIRLTEHPLSPTFPVSARVCCYLFGCHWKQDKTTTTKIHSNPALVLSLNWGGRSSIYSLNQQMGEEGYQHRFSKKWPEAPLFRAVQVGLCHVGFLITARWSGKVYLLPSRVLDKGLPHSYFWESRKGNPKEAWVLEHKSYHAHPTLHSHTQTHIP